MSVRRYKLSQDFLDRYKNVEPAWGFKDDAGNSIGEITFLRSYSRLKDDGSKETWAETCQRVIEGMFSIQREHCRMNRLPWDYKKAQRTAQDAYDRMFNFKWLPPGRGIANMGASFVVDEWDSTPLQNCAFVSTRRHFSESMHFLMLASMNGVGVGLDVAGQGHIQVRGATTNEHAWFVIPDTREGWAEALQLLIESHLAGTPKPHFDYSEIRPAGTIIKRFGGTASGPEVLQGLLEWIDELLTSRAGTTLSARDIADISNKIGVCVISGSSRRSAEILLGEADDQEYLDLKNMGRMVDGEWVPGPAADRAGWAFMSNNSVYAEVGMDYSECAERTRLNGEPGYVWMDVTRNYGRIKDGKDGKDLGAKGFNPCGEQPLEDFEMCTLVSTYPMRHESTEDYLRTLKVAYLYGKTVTLLPTVFEQTNAVMARNRRIGLSQAGITTYVEKHGIAQWRKLADAGYEEIKRLDDVYSRWLCVRNSIRTTTVKPDGSTALLTGDSPGIHWNPAGGYYIRRVTMTPGILLTELQEAGYPVEESHHSKGQFVVSFPIKSPFTRSEQDVSIWEKAAMAAQAQYWWSDNSVSVTLSFDPATEGHEIEKILSIYEGQLKSASFLPMDKGVYPQMPYEEITEEEYKALAETLMPILRDNVYATGVDAEVEKFCTTDKCEVPVVA